MVRKCFVPGCYSNRSLYGYVTVFKLPKDRNTRELWLKKIGRNSSEVSENDVVCINHFEERFILKYDVFPILNGEPIILKRRAPKLRWDAYPSIFHIQTQSLSRITNERGKKILQITWQQEKQGIANPAGFPTDPLNLPPENTEPSIFTKLGLSAPASTSKSASNATTASTSKSAIEYVADEGDDLEISLIDDVLDNSNSCESLSLEEVAKYKSLCRVCGQMESDMINLFDCPAFEMGILRKIEDYLKIKIEEKGYLPTEICKSCISNLDLCDRFITMARNANIKLHEMYSAQMEYLIQNEPPMTCEYCDKEFRSPTLLNLHLTTHSTAAVFLCEICGKTFKNAEGLVCHKRTHRELAEKKKHACTKCAKTFRSKFDLSEHNNLHLDLTPYSCAKCGKSFHRRAQLRQHAQVHGAATARLKNACAVCGKTFTRYADLRMHRRRHELGRTYQCRVCQLRLPTINELLSHRRTHRTTAQNDDLKPSPETGLMPSQDGSYRCKYCNKWLKTYNYLARHLRMVHSWDVPEKPYQCQHCDKRFLSEALRRVHENVHSDVSPYLCTICHKTFKSTNVLNQHLRDHSALTSYECPHCDKRFKRKGNLGVHVRTHTGLKPFICRVCTRAFAQKADMLKHVARQHTRRENTSDVKISESVDNEHRETIHVNKSNGDLEELKNMLEDEDCKENVNLRYNNEEFVGYKGNMNVSDDDEELEEHEETPNFNVNDEEIEEHRENPNFNVNDEEMEEHRENVTIDGEET